MSLGHIIKRVFGKLRKVSGTSFIKVFIKRTTTEDSFYCKTFQRVCTHSWNAFQGFHACHVLGYFGLM